MNGIWIRSQDGTSIELGRLIRVEPSRDDDDGFCVCVDYEPYGTYPTEARALEVLTEIQLHLNRVLRNAEPHAVFYMPKE